MCRHLSSSLGKGLADFEGEDHLAANLGPRDPPPQPPSAEGMPEPPTLSCPTESEGCFLQDLPGYQSLGQAADPS